ncbi:AIG2-like family protein [Aspergillus tubingensis]|uniref:Uncharacterized protein n=1 Tax=Aspergillus niger TaxID=5061 RepID=A0A100IM68_ASPNG|nr:AIG2-like family protein [Aspergillus tubingensis]GAQ43784.1 hypothetical protein AKAW_06493 [Aspergillus niger]GFN21196.1 AIG2-like family protein [Aspergillus tubingensis]GLA96065.1 hypothetical protein AtubIFM57143_003529 [Aspergillus tubingensis]GLB21295.1 hypothetical protein AtubIFM61612_011254 [Aspergillus tubingensis]
MPLRITPSHKAVYVPSSDTAPDSSDLSELSEDDHFAQDDSDDETLFDHNSYEIGPAIATRQLSIHHYNVKEWDTRDAYRELYKHWKQTITKSFAVEDTFHHEHSETHNNITVKALIPTWPGYMGFIRYSKITGTITFINADAYLLQSTHTIEPEDSTTDNINNTDALFQFQNDRLKAIAYVLLLSGFNIQITSRNHIWTFNLSLTPVSSTSPSRNIPRISCTVNTLTHTHNPIPPNNTLTITITSQYPSPLQPQTFRNWLRTSLYLTHPNPNPLSLNIHTGTIANKNKNTIPTPHGTILLAPTHSGTLYLNGILLPERNFPRAQYKYGYDFHYGIPTTSGRRLASAVHELDLICCIWDAAIREKSVYAVPRFVDMVLEGGDGGSWVVDVRGVEDGAGMGDEAVEAVWWAIVVRGYYCCEECKAGEIRRMLGKEPVKVPVGLWGAFRRLGFVGRVWERDGRDGR